MSGLPYRDSRVGQAVGCNIDCNAGPDDCGARKRRVE
jgi:hypothetical protein